MIAKAEKKHSYLSALMLAEEGLQLVLRAGVGALAIYLIGTLPFLIGAIYYWSAMTHSAHAYVFASSGALGLALLFVWMKTLQSRYGQHLRNAVMDGELSPWTAAEFFRTLCRQGALHATFVLVYPVAALLLLPMAYTVAWYQNVSVLEDGGTTSLRDLSRQAAGQAALWPRQNHALLWLSSPLMVIAGGMIYLITFPVLGGLQQGFDETSLLLSLSSIYGTLVILATLPLAPAATALAVGIGATLFFAIEFFHVLSGADTLYTRNPGALLGDSSFVALICALTYVALDPVLKAAYAIRCHEGLSLHTGADLRVALQRIRKARRIAATGILVLGPLTLALHSSDARAQSTPASPPSQAATLDQALQQELAQSQYTWRMPREIKPATDMPWLLQAVADFGKDFRDWVKSTVDWARETWERWKDWLQGDEPITPSSGLLSGFSPSLRILTVVIGLILVVLTGYLIWLSLRQRHSVLLAAAAPLEARTPDLEDEATTATDLPEDEWFTLAQQLAASGDFRLAARALFFSNLATLARREIIRIARFKSNLDYQNEMARRASSLGEAPAHFSRVALLYESVWYGEHEANAQVLNQMHAHQEGLRLALD